MTKQILIVLYSLTRLLYFTEGKKTATCKSEITLDFGFLIWYIEHTNIQTL